MKIGSVLLFSAVLTSVVCHAQTQTNTFPASGNVGIGIASPTYPLDVSVNGRNDVVRIANTIGAQRAYIDFLTYGGNYVSSRIGSIDMGHFNSSLVFEVANSSTPGDITIEAMRILNNGNVGLGTALPVYPLHVSGSGDMQIGISSTDTNAHAWTLQSSGNNAGNLGKFQIIDRTLGPARLVIDTGGNVGIGTTSPGAKLEVAGNFKLTSGSGASMTFADGTTQSTAWTGVLCGGDYAEAVDAVGGRKLYEPGDVLVLSEGANAEVAKSSEPYSTMVAGIFATKPGVIGRRQSLLDDSKNLPMAMVGIVPTKVTTENGPIHRGDLLVTSSTPGYAMKGSDRTRMLGAVIGKAVGSLDSGDGVIEVLVTLQ